MSVSRGLSFIFIFTLVIFTPSMVRALPSGLLSNLSPLDGVIIMQVDDNYLIDLDATKGLAEGDLFSVITKGKAIVHPTTGKVIGSLDRVEGWLEVTRIKSGYAYARPLNPKSDFTKGTRIQRYQNLPAVFWDYTGAGEALFNELRAELPHLEWHNYAKEQAQRPATPAPVSGDEPSLTFIYQGEQLQIKGLNFQTIGSYPFPLATTTTTNTSSSPLLLTAASPATNTERASGLLAPAAQKSSTGIVQNQVQSTENIWTLADWQDNSNGLEIADFDQDGINEIVLLRKNSLEIGQIINKKYQKKLSLPLTGVEKTLTISSADLDADGRPELFISAMDGLEVNSLIVAVKNGTYQIVQKHLPWFLLATQSPTGEKIVLGQRLGDDVNVFEPQIDKIEFKNGTYGSAGKYAHPWQTNIFSLQPFSETDGTARFAEIADNNRLRVFSHEAKELWESTAKFGGSVMFFPLADNAGGADWATTFVYLKPRLAMLDNSTILAPFNDGWRLSKSLQPIGPGQVYALKWDGSTMTELWHTEPQQGSLVDFQYADIDNDGSPEVVLLLQTKRADLLNKGKSAVKVFEIN